MNFSFSIFNSPFSVHLMEIALYLLPVTLGDTPWEKVLPGYNKEIIVGIRHFIVEDVRSARRFLFIRSTNIRLLRIFRAI